MVYKMNTGENLLWCEKYRPKSLSDVILPDKLLAGFKTFVEQRYVPNMLFVGSAGVGKTSLARALLNDIESDYIVINGSMNGNIDTLRNEIMHYASTVSFNSNRKYVILDEADYLNPNSTQPALRNFMEEYSKNCGFILTANYQNKLIDPLQSRCSVVNFTIDKADKPGMALKFFKRVFDILETEGVAYSKPAVAELINKHFPDFRRVLNELQRYAANGSIDAGILTSFNDANIKKLVELLKNKEFTAMRKWVSENIDIDTAVLMRKFYDTAYDYVEPIDIPQMVLLINEYQYKAAFVADREINTAAFLTEVMTSCRFK